MRGRNRWVLSLNTFVPHTRKGVIMKVRGLVIFLFALFLVGGLAPVGQTNAADKTEFTGTETFDPYNVLGNGSVGTILDPGTVTCPGHDPTGDPAQPCPPGSRRNIRN